MVIKEVPAWAGKLIVIGILLPMVCFMFLQGGENRTGFVHTALTANVEIPFLWGQNPVVCAQESVKRILDENLGFDRPSTSYACQRNTLVPYRIVMLLSAFMIILGVYMYARGNKLPNLWPTDWKVFDEANVKGERRGAKPALRMEDPEDKPISPRDGGFG